MTKENFTFQNPSTKIVDKFFGKTQNAKDARRFSEEDIKRMNEMRYFEKKTCSEISKVFNCAASTIVRYTNPDALQKGKERAKLYEKTDQGKAVRKKARKKGKEKKRIQNIEYLNTERGFLVAKFNDSKRSTIAKKKKGINIDFDITMEEYLLLWEKHKRKYGWVCYYTGLPITIGRKLAIKGAKKRHSTPPSLLSVDRFDSKKGYTKDNIVFCRWDFNNRKGNISVEDCMIILQKHHQRTMRVGRRLYSQGGLVC